MGKSPQLKAIRKLESLNLIFTDLRGLPAVRHFKPNLDTTIILNLLNENEEVKKNPEQHNDSNEPQLSATEGEHVESKSDNASIPEQKKEVKKKNKPNKDSNFEKLWALYPNKKGKGHVNKNKKEEINNYHDLEELINYLKKYTQDKILKINGGWKELKGGSRFFNNLIEDINKQKGIETEIEEMKNTKIVEVETMEVNEVKEAKKSKNILF